MDKKSIILNSIIKEYLKRNEPIGSNELRMKLRFKISPSTIRVYFKELSNIGELKKVHISSGRVPTHKALKNYWQKSIDTKKTLHLKRENLFIWRRRRDIFCFIKKISIDKLQEVINVKNRFLLLIFNNKEIVIKYNEKIEKFFKGFLSTHIEDLRRISKEIGLYEVSKKLDISIERDKIFESGKGIIFKISKEYNNDDLIDYYLNSKNFDTLKNGIYFEEDNIVPKGYMAIKLDVKYEKESAKLFCVGDLKSNFEQFLKGVDVV